MSFNSRAKIVSAISFVFLLSACSQNSPTMQSENTKQMNNVESFRGLEVPVTFNHNNTWRVQTTGLNTVTLLSPATVIEQQASAPTAEGPEGNAIAEAFGKPDMEISFYTNIADEPINKDLKLGAKSVDELVKKDVFTAMGEVSVNGKQGYAVCDGELLCPYYWYIQTPGQIYRIYFGKRINPENLTLTTDEQTVIDSLELLE